MAKSFLVSDLADELEKLKKRNSKQILYQVGAPTGKATCGYVFAIDESTGNAYYKAADGTWTAFIGGGGGGGYWTATGADIANNNTGLVNIIGSVYTNGIFSADGTGGQVSIGDFNTTVNGTTLTISDTNQSITTQFAGYPHGLFQLQATGGIVTLGTTHGDAGNTNLIINDSAGTIITSSSSYGDGLFNLQNTNGLAAIGDWNSNNNETYVGVNDSTENITLNAGDSYVNMNNTSTLISNTQTLLYVDSSSIRSDFQSYGASLFTFVNTGYVGLGDWSGTINKTAIIIDDENKIISSVGSSYANGLFNINYNTSNRTVSLGDWSANVNKTGFVIDDHNKVITTTFTTYPNHGLFKLQNTAGIAAIGDWATDVNGTAVVITDSSRVVSVRCLAMGVGVINPNPYAILDLTSTISGFLPPRMTTAEKLAIVVPAEGLVVYDLTLHKLCIYTGSAWETVTSI